jgi:uncharacterized membrane protein YeaQ/YmgE (transglycosylase-associated protein family)
VQLILFLVFGLVVGVIARLVVPGRKPGGFFASIVIGVLGSFLGGFVGRGLGFYGQGQTAGFLMSVFGAIVLLVVYHAVSRKTAGS